MTAPTPAELPDPDARKRPGVAREYRTPEIVVYWESQLCIHTARCLRSLPQVFDVHRRPWVMVDAAAADAIAETVMRCPTGALRFERLDGAPQEPIPSPAVIEAQPDGPLYVRGAVIVDQEGVAHPLPRAALCRCGESNNKPFCDGMHDRIGFRTT